MNLENNFYISLMKHFDLIKTQIMTWGCRQYREIKRSVFDDDNLSEKLKNRQSLWKYREL
jgi:hypothetical protein